MKFKLFLKFLYDLASLILTIVQNILPIVKVSTTKSYTESIIIQISFNGFCLLLICIALFCETGFSFLDLICTDKEYAEVRGNDIYNFKVDPHYKNKRFISNCCGNLAKLGSGILTATTNWTAFGILESQRGNSTLI